MGVVSYPCKRKSNFQQIGEEWIPLLTGKNTHVNKRNRIKTYAFYILWFILNLFKGDVINSLKTILLFGCAKKKKNKKTIKRYKTFPSTERQSFYTYFFGLKTLNFKKCLYQDFSSTNNLENPITDHVHNMCQHPLFNRQFQSLLINQTIWQRFLLMQCWK